MSSRHKIQTQEELMDIYVAWKMGARVELCYRDAAKWLPHDDYDSLRSDLTSYYLYQMAVENRGHGCNMVFRLK